MTEREERGIEPLRSEPGVADLVELLHSDPKIIAWLGLEPPGLSSASSQVRPNGRSRRNTKIELLREVPLFAGCSRRQLSALAPLVDELDVPAGRKLIRQGERGLEFFLIVEGSATVTRDAQMLQILDSGDWAGEIGLIMERPRTATVVTTTPGRLLVLTDRAFRSALEQIPSIAFKLVRRLAETIARDPDLTSIRANEIARAGRPIPASR